MPTPAYAKVGMESPAKVVGKAQRASGPLTLSEAECASGAECCFNRDGYGLAV